MAEMHGIIRPPLHAHHRQRGPIAHHELDVVRVRGVVARVAGGVHARRATERVDLDAGVVAERGRTGRLQRGDGLEGRVLGVGRARLVHLVGEGDDLVAGGTEELLVLAELARVAGRQDQAPGAQVSFSASFWAAISSVIPLPASASICSSSARLKGSPSAVAWSSISRPSSPMTQLRSVPAAKSSV